MSIELNENDIVLLNIALDRLYKEVYNRHMKAQIALLRDKVNGK
jgi:hypothetical protein